MTRLALGCAVALLLAACGDDGGGDGTASAGSSGATSSTGGDGSTSATPTSTTADDTTTAADGSSGEASSSSAGSSSGGSSSTGEPIECGDPVAGAYNACFDENGDPMPVLCDFMGTAESVGQVDCLIGPTEGANVCMIRGCESDCDCFEAPATGDAPSVCRDVAGIGMACILPCNDGQTCPDGMTCDSGICWHGL